MTDLRIKMRQVAMFEEARRRGYTRAMIRQRGGFGESTVRMWAEGVNEISLHAFVQLAETGALPMDLLSDLLGDDLEMVRAGAGEVDHAALAGHAAGHLARYTASRDPESEAGVDIGPREQSDLDASARRIRAVAGDGEAAA